MEINQEFGIKFFNNIGERPVVFCTNCGLYHYESITDENNTNGLWLFHDTENEEYFLGCPQCETDAYLLNCEEEEIEFS